MSYSPTDYVYVDELGYSVHKQEYEDMQNSIRAEIKKDHESPCKTCKQLPCDCPPKEELY